MEYSFRAIEKKWQQYWLKNKTFKVRVDQQKPKFYVLDMFPYPSGAGLHVGHPLGYIASDIFTRYKRLKGYNVLHPMGYDAYGLPAEQYAVQTGQHPAITTDRNIKRYREQLDKLGFSYDWDREVRTSDPAYYKWTQWTFIQLFHSWFNNKTQAAEPINTLIKEFEKNGNTDIDAACGEIGVFSSTDWIFWDERNKQEALMYYRLAYLSDTLVNWCPELGTVLANDEVKEGYSVRGGHPVIRKQMKQWLLRITAYAERLLQGLEKLEWSDSLKEIQRNWIGKSKGASVNFKVVDHAETIEVFTTRPDTLFGATYMVLAPEHELLNQITTNEHRIRVEEYVKTAKNRSERERMAEVKKITGEFTGAYAINPLNNEQIPIWVADYVLAGYGTGAIMAVPAHDSRDYAFASHFNLPVREVVSGGDISRESYDAKEGTLVNSGFLNGMDVNKAMAAAIEKIEELGVGYGTVNYRLRDAIFSRQRYWGEPFPVYYKNGIPYTLNADQLPLELPDVESFLPTETGEPPLARAKKWETDEGYPLETNTMPGFAGSSGYYLRYMDPRNYEAYFSKEANEYWQNVDLYIGGIEHATGHLMYSRFWNKFLYDLGYVVDDEPFKKLVNQGMIQGRSSIVYRIKGTNTFISKNRINTDLTTEEKQKAGINEKHPEVIPMHTDVSIVDNDILDMQAFRNWRKDLSDAQFIVDQEGNYMCGFEIEKMSKSLYNVVNPDDLIENYGADTLRMYEMFLGPLTDSKPWDTKGIEGVFRFIRKFRKLYHNEDEKFNVADEEPGKEEYKALHKTIQKVQTDIERLSFNTAVSAFMICTNKLTDLKCNKRAILEPLSVLISPYAPHIAEELWEKFGNEGSVAFAKFPAFRHEYVVENTFTYPVSFNGKKRFELELPNDMSKEDMEKAVLDAPEAQKWIEDKSPRKIIIVPRRIINVVV